MIISCIKFVLLTPFALPLTTNFTGAYCNAGPKFSPESENADMGWTLKGYCDGTLAPTTSPIVYPTQKCRYYVGTQAHIINAWSESDLDSYVAGTRVRVNDKIFKCKGAPYSNWCKCEL